MNNKHNPRETMSKITLNCKECKVSFCDFEEVKSDERTCQFTTKPELKTTKVIDEGMWCQNCGGLLSFTTPKFHQCTTQRGISYQSRGVPNHS